MSLTERIPGMVPGRKARNAAIGAIYAFVLLAVVVNMGMSLGDPEASANGEQLTQDEAETMFIETLQDDGYSVEGAGHYGGIFSVDSTSEAETEDEMVSEAHAYADAYTDVVDEGHGDERMVVYAFDSGDAELFSFEVEAAWAEERLNGEIDDDEFYDRVTETVEVE